MTQAYLHWDVFTGERFFGNQLAVFTDARGLDTATMQRIAREMNFAESTFILPAESPGTDVRMRIFTPTQEMPMAGHPTIGSTFCLAHTGVLAPAEAGGVRVERRADARRPRVARHAPGLRVDDTGPAAVRPRCRRSRARVLHPGTRRSAT